MLIMLPELLSFECFNLVQHVDFATHSKGHTLDLMHCWSNVSVLGSQIGLSDQLNCKMRIPCLRVKSTITYRNLNSVNPLNLYKLISLISLNTYPYQT